MKEKELLLLRLVEIMFEKQQTFLLLDELYEDEIVGSFIRNIQIDSPYQQLLFEGVLSQFSNREELFVSVTVENYFHHLLALVLQKEMHFSTPESLIQLVESNKLKGLKEGVSNLLSFDIELGVYNRITQLIDLSNGKDEILELCVMPLVNSLIIHGVEKTVEVILENPTDNDWMLILKFEKQLEELELYVLREKLLTTVIQLNPLKTKIELLNGLNSIHFIDENEKVLCLNKFKISYLEFENDYDLNFSMGSLEIGFGNFNSALLYLEKCCKILRKPIEEFDLSKISLLSNLGYVWNRLGNFIKAMEFCELILKIERKYLNENHPWIAITYESIGFNYFCLENFNLAYSYTYKSLLIELKVYGKQSNKVATTLKGLGKIMESSGDFVKSIDFYKNSLSIEKKIFGDYHFNISANLIQIGELYIILKDFVKAKDCFIQAFNLKKDNYRTCNFELSNLQFTIGLCFKNFKDFYNAVEYFKKGYQYSKSGGFPFQIAQCYEALNDQENTLDYYIQSATIRKDDPEVGLEAESTQEAISNAKRLAKELGKENELPDWMK